MEPSESRRNLTEQELREHLLAGQVIPAHPLALTSRRRIDEARQRTLTSYYVEAGAGGIAVGVHTTQFALRDHGLLKPVLELAREAADAALERRGGRSFVKIAGAIGSTGSALREAAIAADLGFDAVLLSLAGLDDHDDASLVQHCRAVSEVLPLVGFYLQPAAGGRPLSEGFWRAIAELPRLVAVKIAPFDRYRTLEVVRAITESGRDDVALYTGNDDSIIHDLLTPFPVEVDGQRSHRYMDGGLLGHWAVWTRTAVRLLEEIRAARGSGQLDLSWLETAAAVTEMNAAVFDAAHGFAGCIPGIHEVLRLQGMLEGSWTLDPREILSPGQGAEIARVIRRYPELAVA